ncbi:MAG: hypothetical protein ACYTGZ_05185 [Planctomycetota bacterium]|jgi:hypothetical protein
MASIARFGRIALALIVASCAGNGEGSGDSSGEKTYPRTRIAFKQHYEGGVTLVMENLAGRSLVDMRSRVVKKGDVPVAWVPDEVMRKTMRAMDKHDFDRYARPRPADPKSLGVRSEITVTGERTSQRSFMRRRGQPLKEAQSFQECASLFREVWTAYRPTYQAVAGKGEFGVKRAGYKRGK